MRSKNTFIKKLKILYIIQIIYKMSSFNEQIVYGIRISLKNKRMENFKKLFKIYFLSEVSYTKNYDLFCDMYFDVPQGELRYEFLFENEETGEKKWKIMTYEDFDELEDQKFQFDKDGKLTVLSKFLINGKYV